ncbi:MAG: flagellar basal body protein FliL [Verrucomicrobia bacterium]|nr:MAG: flagellar basal body protein FliL [Verrucomicrobiota bacterium]
MPKEDPKDKGAADKKGGSSAIAGWLPVLVVLVLVPALSYAMAEFVLFPKLEAKLAALGVSEQGAAAPAAGGGHGASHGGGHGGGHGEEMEPTHSYEFTNVVANLAGSMRSRFIKVSFTAYSSDPELEHKVEANKAKLLDAAIGVLSTLTLSDLENPGVKNKVRSDLVFAFEAVMRERLIEEIYFSEFVIQ